MQSIKEVNYELNLTAEEPIRLQDSETKLYTVLWKANGPLSTEDKKNLNRFINITYSQLVADWTSTLGNNLKEEHAAIKQCTIEDLGNDTYAR